MKHVSNYMRVMPGGHCYNCHLDYADTHDYLECRRVNGEDNYHAPCDERCKDSKFYNAGNDLMKGLRVDEHGRIEKM